MTTFSGPKIFGAWRAGRADVKLHALSVFALSVAFICLSASLLLVFNLAAVRDRWSRAGRATAYLRDDASEASVLEIARALGATEGVKQVRHLSSVEARREIIGEERNSSLAVLPASAFPASLEIHFAESAAPSEVERVALKLRALPPIESVETYQKWTDRLSELLGGGVTASICLAFVVLGAVASVIGSTMRLLLHRRRIEVEVLKLVGATDSFVRRPFVVEGAAQGAAGALLSLVVLGFLFLVVRSRFDRELEAFLGISPSFLPLWVSFGMVGLGAALGAATATLSLRKMVRV